MFRCGLGVDNFCAFKRMRGNLNAEDAKVSQSAQKEFRKNLEFFYFFLLLRLLRNLRVLCVQKCLQSLQLLRRSNRDQGRPQHALGNRVAFLQHAHHGVGVLIGGDHADGLVFVGVEFFARWWLDGQHFVAL
jgi:hypothetical protein